MSYRLDRRTRTDEARRFITPEDFFTQDALEYIHRHGHLVAEAAKALGAPPLCVEVNDAAYTLLCTGNALEVRRSHVDGALTISLSAPEFSDWVQNQISLNGLVTSRKLKFRGATPSAVSLWDSLWLALLEGWPVTVATMRFLDRAGAPLDLSSAFSPDANPDDIAHFLREAGYLRLKGWLDPDELAVISNDMDKALPLYREGDGKSWWASLSDGSRVCVRLQRFVEHSPTTARLLSSDRWERLRQTLAASDHLARVPVEGTIIEALYKPVGVIAGPSDLSFHRDCHLGRHSYVCSRMTLGIPLTPSSEENGLLQVIAGSHRAVMPVEVAKTNSYLPIVNLPTEPGDISVHLSCTLHASTPPVFAERRVMYTEIPLASIKDGGVPADTSVNSVRERVNDILRVE